MDFVRNLERRFPLFLRYAVIFVLVPGFCVAVSLVIIILVRTLGLCILSANPLPVDTEEDIYSCDAAGWSEIWLVGVSQLFSFASPIYCVLSYYPFYISFPEVVNCRDRSNRIIGLTSVALLYIAVLITFVVPAEWNIMSIVAARIFLVIYHYIAVPLYWRSKIILRNRNLFLCQMEHNWLCCKEVAYFRIAGYSWLELALYFSVAINILRLLVLGTTGVSISPILSLPMFIIGFILWQERNLHFYRDFSYTYLLCLFPGIIIPLCTYLWRVMKQLLVIQDFGAQLGILIVYNLILLAVTRIIKFWACSSVEKRKDAVKLMFPFRFLEHYFQYLLLYCVRNILSTKFWVASAIVLLTNILDTTGLIGDLYDTLVIRIKKRKFGLGRTLNEQEELRLQLEAFNGSLPAILNSNIKFDSGLDGSSSFPLDPEKLIDIVVFTLNIIHQKCFCMILVAGLVSAQVLLDANISYFSNSFKTPCSMSCNFQRPPQGPEFVFYRPIIMYAQYVIVGFVALIFWRKRVRGIIVKYPSLSKYLESQQTSIAADMDNDAGAVELSHPYKNLDQSSSHRIITEINNRNVSPDNSYQADRQRKVKNLEEDRKRVLRGHVSMIWSDPGYIIFIICSIISISWAAISSTAEGVQSI